MAQIRQWYPHHIDDFNRWTKKLSLAERGAYRALMDVYWENGGPIELDEREICRSINCFPDEWAEVRDKVLPFFELVDGRLHHPRIEEELEKARKVSERNRENGKTGGRPKKAQLKPKSQPTENPHKTQEKPSGLCLGNPEETQTETHARVAVEVTNISPSIDRSSLSSPSGIADAKPGRSSGITSLISEPIPSFDSFWAEYPARLNDSRRVKVGKAEAKTKWGTLAPATKRAAMDGLPVFIEASGDKPCDAVRYLRHRKWEGVEVEDVPAGTGPPARKTADDLARERAVESTRQLAKKLGLTGEDQHGNDPANSAGARPSPRGIVGNVDQSGGGSGFSQDGDSPQVRLLA